MIEQWFLDLDGVRSGPYQTPEVMSLIAEGEVLPHHRISTSLREQKWVTILDWRLDQAKISQKVPSPYSTSRSEVSSVEGLQEDTGKLGQVPLGAKSASPMQHVQPTPIPAPTIPQAPNPIPEVKYAPVAEAAPPSPEVLSNPSHFVEEQVNLPVEAKETPQKAEAHEVEESMALPKEETPAFSRKQSPETPVRVQKTISEPYAPPSAVEEMNLDQNGEVTSGGNKRDPMSEMFDMLQNTKQKRQARQSHEASVGISIEQDHGEPAKKSSFSLGRTLLIGIGVCLVGFSIGQIFQLSTPPKEEASSQPATKFTTPPSTAHIQTPGEVEVIDRSTDKMTIKGYVPKDGPPAQPTKANAKSLHGGATVNPETPQTEKELEELRNLKKELQELKNLKSGEDDPYDPPADSNPGLEPGRVDPNVIDPNNPNNGPTTTYPSEGGPPPLNNSGR